MAHPFAGSGMTCGKAVSAICRERNGLRRAVVFAAPHAVDQENGTFNRAHTQDVVRAVAQALT